MNERGVYLGTKPVEGYESIATHWAIRVGDDNWWEIDGGSGNEESNLFKNTIKLASWKCFLQKWSKKEQLVKFSKEKMLGQVLK